MDLMTFDNILNLKNISCQPKSLWSHSLRFQNCCGAESQRGNTSKVSDEEVNVEPTDLLTSSLSKWHQGDELQLHSCLMAGDIEEHAPTHRSSKRMRRPFASTACDEENNGSRPQVRSRTPGMSGVKSIWLHACLTISLTDCDLSLLRNGKETTRPRCYKTAQSGCQQWFCN